MIFEYIRLAFATFLVLLPGKLVARALGRRSTSAALAWSLACIFVAWSAVFILHRSIHLALIVLLLIGVCALVARRFTREPGSQSEPGS